MKQVVWYLVFMFFNGSVALYCSNDQYKGDGAFRFLSGTRGTCTYKFNSHNGDVMKIQWSGIFNVEGLMPSCYGKDYVKVYIG